MTIGELKQIVLSLPPEYKHFWVTIEMVNGVEAVLRDIDRNRNGVRGIIAHFVEPIPRDFKDDRPLHCWAASATIVRLKNGGVELRIANGGDCPSLDGKFMKPEEEDTPQQLLLPAGKGIVKR